MGRVTSILALLAPLALLVPLMGSGCAHGSAHHPEWDYTQEHGPQHWSELDEDYEQCAAGDMQSPVDLPREVIEDASHLQFAYEPDALRIVDNGHTIQINHQGESTLSLDGETFRLVQYHFHSPSEHAEQGDRHTLELHLVHVDEAGNYAVIGVFLEAPETEATGGTTEAAAENPAHESLWRHLPEHHEMDERVFTGEEVDPLSFIPSAERRAHYRYHGSLTTPPCTETVTWLVMAEPLAVTPEHIQAFQELYRANARPLQPRPQWCLDVEATHSSEDPGVSEE